MMKILVCNTLENNGGAAKSASRIVAALRETSLNIVHFTAYKYSKNNNTLTNNTIFWTCFKKFIPKIDVIPKLLYSNNRKIPFSSGLFSFKNGLIIEKENPDIVHLNYINMGMFSITEIAKIEKPIVWTLHDSWTFTGGCHLPNTCKNYQTKCQNCPALESKKSPDLSTHIFNLKQKLWVDKNITLVCPSLWMKNMAQKSKLFKNKNIIHIPNPIDTNKYRPKNKKSARKRLGLNPNTRYLLFGAVNALKDTNKGFRLLQEAINKYTNLKDTELIILGSTEEKIPLNIPTKHFEYIENEESLVSLYSAVDITIVPSISENLPNIVMESLACGTPCIGFKIGGIPEILNNKNLGFLVEPYDTKKLGAIIQKSLSTKFNPNYLHTSIEQRFSYKRIGEQYLKLYLNLLK